MRRRTSVPARKSGAARPAATPASTRKSKGLMQSGNRAVSQAIGDLQHSFGQDFSGVHVHNTPQANQTADALGANAFTHGDDIFLGSKAPSPTSAEGRKLLAHELAHVVQQREATSVDPEAVGPENDAFEHSANNAAQQAMLGRRAQSGAAGTTPAVQRQGAGDKKVDLDQVMKDIHAQINPPPLVPQVQGAQEPDKKIKSVPKNALVPRRIRPIVDLFTGAKEKQMNEPQKLDKQRDPGTRDIGAEADKAIGTTLLPQIPLHLIFDKITEKKQRPPSKTTDEPQQKPDDGAPSKDAKAQDPKAQQAAASELETGLAGAIAAAAKGGQAAAELHLDTKSGADREAILAQLQAMVEAGLSKSPKVTSVKVYFGTELAKTLTAGAKK